MQDARLECFVIGCENVRAVEILTNEAKNDHWYCMAHDVRDAQKANQALFDSAKVMAEYVGRIAIIGGDILIAAHAKLRVNDTQEDKEEK